MTLVKVKGDLIAMAEHGMFDIIVHGCNCFCTMGSGIAGQLARAYPEVALADRQTKSGDRKKLGAFTTAVVTSPLDVTFTVVNAYTQYSFGGQKDLFEYEAFECILDKMYLLLTEGSAAAYAKPDYADSPIRIGFPMIGAGLAGGDWQRIESLIADFAEKAEPEVRVTIVEYEPVKHPNSSGFTVRYDENKKKWFVEKWNSMGNCFTHYEQVSEDFSTLGEAQEALSTF